MSEMAVVRSGKIEYTERAATYDAAAAMRGDPVRALVELVTNADDAYDEAGHGGPIRIVAEHTRSGEFARISVGDEATGMALDTIQEKLLTAGARQSGHELGKKRRGVLGRGAKDVSYFGKATFESIHDGRYTHVTLRPNAYEGLDSRPAASDDYTRMNVTPGGSGVVATMYVRVGTHSIPRHETLAKRLRQHVQLRNIMTDETRVVSLARNAEREERLTYTPPAGLTPVGAPMPLSVSGYPGAQARLTLWRSEVPLPDVRDFSRDAGILVIGRRAVYESTYFGCENRPGSRNYIGRLECSTLDALQQAYDDIVFDQGGEPPADNPGPIVLRTRDGLDDSHPFVRALATAVDAKLTPLVDEAERQEEEKGGRQTQETTKRMRDMARKLSALYDTIAKELETETETGSSGDSSAVPTPVAFEVIPPLDTVKLEPGQSMVFTARAWPEAWPGDAPAPDAMEVTASAEEEVVATVEPARRTLTPDPRCDGRFRGTFTVRANSQQDATAVTIRLGRMAHEMVVEVARAEPQPVVAPTRLMWDHRAYTAKLGSPKMLVLMGPHELVRDGAREPVLLGTNSQVFDVPENVSWHLVQAADGQRWYEAPLEVVGRVTGSAQLRARYAGRVAVCQLTITEHGGRGLFDFQVVDRLHKYETQGRADWDFTAPGGSRLLLIFGRDPSLSAVFGRKLVNQETVQSRLLIAEVVAAALSHDMLQNQQRRSPETAPRDAGEYARRFNEHFGRFVRAAQQIQVPEVISRRLGQ